MDRTDALRYFLTRRPSWAQRPFQWGVNPSRPLKILFSLTKTGPANSELPKGFPMAIAIKKTAAIAIAAGLTFAGSAGIAAQNALAQTTNTVAPTLRATEQKAAASSIDPGNVFSLTINKRINPSELRVGTGQADKEVKGDALQGVDFKIQKLKGDIRDQAEFNRLAKLTQEYNKAGSAKSTLDFDQDFGEKNETTNADGVISLTDLPAGAYLVTEQKLDPKKAQPIQDPAITKNGTESYIESDPFIVFLPMTNPAGDGWINDVNVYPKNSFVRVEKDVVDEGKHVVKGDKVKYTLTGIVPSAKEGQRLDWFGLRDAYNSNEITPDYDNLKIRIENADGTVKNDALTKGTDYHAADDAGYDSVEGNLAQGANAGFYVGVAPSLLSPGDRVVVEVEATLLQDPNHDQLVENSVREYFRTSSVDSGTGNVPPDTPPTTPPGDTPPPNETPNDKVKTYFGNITVYKRGEEQKALAGAEFSIGKCNTAKDAIDGDTIATGTTDAEGKLEFKGLHVTDYVNDEDVAAEVRDTYCVTETKAPEGYALPKNATKPLTLTREDHIGLNGADSTAKFETIADSTIIENGVVIDNVKNSVPLLPSTGGMGVLIIALAGLAIIGGGVYAARRNSQSA